MSKPCCMSSEYNTETPALSALAMIVLSQKDMECCWRRWDAFSKMDLLNSITGYFAKNDSMSLRTSSSAKLARLSKFTHTSLTTCVLSRAQFLESTRVRRQT